jgi:flagellar basal body-associated protein FliL
MDAEKKNIEKKNSKKKSGGELYLILAVIVILVALLIGQRFYFAKSFDRALAAYVENVNKKCPSMLDEDTRLDNVFVIPGNALQYNYTMVNMVKDSVDVDAFSTKMDAVMLNFVKNDDDFDALKKKLVTINYTYHDKYANILTNIKITPERYK